MTATQAGGPQERPKLTPDFLALVTDSRLRLADLSREQAAQILLCRREARKSFGDWCRIALAPQGLAPARFHDMLIGELQQLADGENDRLIVLLPPGHAKSTYVSHLFPPWYMSFRPGARVIAGTHTLSLAERNGRYARNYVSLNTGVLGFDLDPDLSAMTRWATTTKGEYLGAGVGKAIAGYRADLGIIDDPFSSREAAESELNRNTVWDWYRNDFTTRLTPGAPVALLMTRWHPDDLAGRLIEAAQDGTGEPWRVLSLPAFADAGDALGREPGEALWPEMYGLDLLNRRKLVLGERDFAALFQQTPRPDQGSVFRSTAIDMLDVEPLGNLTVRAWDLAATKQTGTHDPDWTVGVKLRRTTDGGFAVLHVERFRAGPEEVEDRIVATAKQDGPTVQIGLPQDPGQAGKMQVAYLVKKLAGFRVTSSLETGDKVTRAMPVASQVNHGNVRLVRGKWNAAFLDELRDFPSGTKDDQVDALSRAFGLVGLAPPPMKISSELLARA